MKFKKQLKEIGFYDSSNGFLTKIVLVLIGLMFFWWIPLRPFFRLLTFPFMLIWALPFALLGLPIMLADMIWCICKD